MPSDSDMEYEVPISARGDMTVETLGISRSLSSPLSVPAVGVRAGRMGKGMAVPGSEKGECYIMGQQRKLSWLVCPTKSDVPLSLN